VAGNQNIHYGLHCNFYPIEAAVVVLLRYSLLSYDSANML
jgi:hypothetical protein